VPSFRSVAPPKSRIGSTTFGDAADDVHTVTAQLTASEGAKFSNDVFLAADDVKLYFGTGNDSNIMYGNSGGGNEFTITVGADGGGIQLPDNDGAAFEIREAGNTYMRFNTGDSYADIKCLKPFGVADDVTLNIGTPTAGGVPSTLEYDADGTLELVVSPPAAGMSIGSGFHRVAVDLDITGSHSSDNTVVNQVQGVKIPNDSIITRVSAITKTLSNLGTAVFNVQLSATRGTATDSAISSGTEILGAGAAGTIDSNNSVASDVIMSSGGVLKKVWMNMSGSNNGFIHKTTADNYVYVCNAGTSNGTTDPATGTLTVIVEYYGID